MSTTRPTDATDREPTDATTPGTRIRLGPATDADGRDLAGAAARAPRTFDPFCTRRCRSLVDGENAAMPRPQGAAGTDADAATDAGTESATDRATVAGD
jgi:endogenous inhibitor of DNA gyrase (YacG/DUF329 family)